MTVFTCLALTKTLVELRFGQSSVVPFCLSEGLLSSKTDFPENFAIGRGLAQTRDGNHELNHCSAFVAVRERLVLPLPRPAAPFPLGAASRPLTGFRYARPQMKSASYLTSVSGLDCFIKVTAYEVELMRRQKWSFRLMALIVDNDEFSMIK